MHSITSTPSGLFQIFQEAAMHLQENFLQSSTTKKVVIVALAIIFFPITLPVAGIACVVFVVIGSISMRHLTFALQRLYILPEANEQLATLSPLVPTPFPPAVCTPSNNPAPLILSNLLSAVPVVVPTDASAPEFSEQLYRRIQGIFNRYTPGALLTRYENDPAGFQRSCNERAQNILREVQALDRSLSIVMVPHTLFEMYAIYNLNLHIRSHNYEQAWRPATPYANDSIERLFPYQYIVYRSFYRLTPEDRTVDAIYRRSLINQWWNEARGQTASTIPRLEGLLRQVIALEASSHQPNDATTLLLYRGGNAEGESWMREGRVSSLSFGAGFFAGFFHDPGAMAATFCAAYNRDTIIVPCDIVDANTRALFFIPDSIDPVVQLLGSGEFFHARTKVPRGSHGHNWPAPLVFPLNRETFEGTFQTSYISRRRILRLPL